MINAVRDVAQGAAIANDSAAAAISYAVARAEAERRTTWRTMGEMALRTLPLLLNSCPYRAMSTSRHRPGYDSYPDDNYSDVGGAARAAVGGQPLRPAE